MRISEIRELEVVKVMATHTWVNRQRASTDVDPLRVRAANDPKIVLQLEQVKQESQQMEHCSLVSGISILCRYQGCA